MTFPSKLSGPAKVPKRVLKLSKRSVHLDAADGLVGNLRRRQSASGGLRLAPPRRSGGL